MGRLVSVPDGRHPRLNDLYLRRGRWVEPDRSDEVVASEGFVDAHGFVPGDAVAAIVNGRLRHLRIVGVALSPEYIYSIRPGEMVPDDRRFGIFWMGERALAGLLDMTGGFNDVTSRSHPGASTPDVVERLDRLLERYGGLGATPRRCSFRTGLSRASCRSCSTSGSSCRCSSSASARSRSTSPWAARWRCSARRSPPSRRSVIPMPPSDGTT